MGMNSRDKKSSSIQKNTNRLSDSKRTTNTREKSESDKKMNSKKKMWSFDALVKAMKPSNMELEYRKNKRYDFDVLQENSEYFQCTTCQTSFETILKKHEKVPIHPCLGVLMCKECCDYYEDGEFSLDSDGEDKYCRWCGQGGTIFGCSQCICGFCVKCIKRHFTLDFYKQIQKDDNWLCFFCDPEPLWYHRFICSLAVEVSESQESISPNSNKNEGKKKKSTSSFYDSDQSWSLKNFIAKSKNEKKNLRKRIYLSSSDESEHEIEENHQKKLKLSRDSLQASPELKESDPAEKLNSDVLKEIERILKLSENQMSFGVTWTTKMLKGLSNVDCKVSHIKLVNKCQKIKSFLSVFSAHLVHLSNCTDSLEKMLLKDDGQKASSLDHPDKEETPYATILQFLAFINNQVKTFMDKGISLSDVLEAEVYDDDNIIGIKKRFNSSKNSSNRDKNSNPNEINKSLRSDDYEDSENKENTEEQKFDDEDKSRDESSLEIVLNSAEMNFRDSEDEYRDLNSSNVTSLEINSQVDAKDDIQEILAILENA